MSFSSFFALGAAVFAAAFGYGAIMPLLPELLAPLLPAAGPVALSWHAGAFAGIYMFAVVLFSPLWGAASDRYGTRSVLLLGLTGSALTVFALAFAEDLWSAYLGRAVQGAFASAILPVATSALAQIPDTAERARKVAGLGAASLLGFFAAPALSAALVSSNVAGPVAAVLYASGLVALSALAIVSSFLKPAPQDARGDPGPGRPLPARFLALNFLAYFGLGAFEVALPLAARGPLAVDPARVSLLFVECSLMMLVAQGALMWAAPYRAHFPKVLIASVAAYGAGLLWLAGTASFSAALSAVGLIAAGSGLVLPLIAFLATLEIEARPGVALGRLTAAGALGQAVGSLSGGALYGYAGMGIFTATAFAVALGAWLASPACAPRWLGGGSRCTRIQEKKEWTAKNSFKMKI
jgi:MFS family permease